jgi:hypothetical protein
MLILLLQNLDRPHQRYRGNLFELFQVLAMSIMSFPYDEQESLYLKLSHLIDKYIAYFKFNRVDLSIDIKALYISIDKKESIKNTNIKNYDDDNDDFFTMGMKLLMGDKNKYDFNEEEYDLALIKKDCIETLKNGEENPFSSLGVLNRDYNYRKFIIKFIFDLLLEVKKLKKSRNKAIIEIVNAIGVKFNKDEYLRQPLVSELNNCAKIDAETTMFLFEYILTSVSLNMRAFMWYLQWIDGYLNLIMDYNLEKNQLFKFFKEYFIKTQERKKFKSLNAKYKKIMKKFENETRGVLF